MEVEEAVSKREISKQEVSSYGKGVAEKVLME